MNLEEYKISGKMLGQGSFGIVGEAILRLTGESHAVKIIEKKNVAAQDYAIFKNESEILKKLNHPYILRFHNYFEDSLNLYLFTEIVQGGELFDRMIENNGFSEKEAQTISRKLFEAVNFCHRNGIVHRDIKAENVLLVSNKSDYDLRLIDFGFAVEAEGITLKGELGTPDYMAPEIWGGDEYYGAPVDMWALGVLVYIILVSYPPFLHHTPLGIKAKIIHGIYEFHPEYWGHISEEARDFVKRLLTVDMDARMTAEEALRHPWLLTDRESRVPSDRSADASDVPAGYMNRPMRRRRTRPFPPPPMTMNRTKHVSRLREAEDSSDTVQELQTSCGYLATLSADTCSELDDCSAVSGYDSDSTGLKSFSFGSSYARSQSTSYTDEDISTSTTKTHRPIGVSAWSNRSGFELNLNHSSVATRSSRMSGCSAVTDNESFCCVQNRSSSALSPSIKIDTEVDIVVSQILFELAKYDEND